MLISQIKIHEYDILLCDRNRHGGGVACCIMQMITLVVIFKPYILRSQQIHFLKCHCQTLGQFSRPPNQTNFFLEIFHKSLSKVDTNNTQTNIIGDFNINFWQNERYIF